MPTIAEAIQIALRHHQAGELAQAEQIYRQVLTADPNHPDAWHLLGLIAHRAGQGEVAVDYIRRAIALRPTTEVFHSNLGAVLVDRGRIDEAIGCQQAALQINPRHAEAHGNLGHALLQLNRLDEALASLQRAIELNPNLADAQNNLGNAFQRLGRMEEAIACYRRVIELRPSMADAYSNLAAALQGVGRLDEAVAMLNHTLRLKPDHAEAYMNLANIMAGQRDRDQAIACYRRAIEIKPEFAAAYNNLGNTFQEQGKLPDALQCYEHVMRLAPSDALRIKMAVVLPVMIESVEEMQRHRRRVKESVERLLHEPLMVEDAEKDVGITNFFLAYHGVNNRNLQARIAALHRHAAPMLSFVAPHCQTPRRGINGAEKIRLGLISKYFFNHPIGQHYARTIQELSRDKFHVTLLRFPTADDGVARAIQASADAVVTLSPRLPRVQQQVAEQQLDALVYTDIGMDPMTYFLSFARLAPVQCAAPGHPDTTGVSTIDYFLSGEDLEPSNGQEHYTERLVRFKNLPTGFALPPLPAPLRSRPSFGLPETGHLYACAQTLFKIHPEFDSLLAEILRADPEANAVFFEYFESHWTHLVRERMRRAIPDVFDRLHFLPRQTLEDFRRVLALADVALDTLHFNGGTTSLETLALGVPLVTLPGEFMRGRQTYSCYRKLGVFDCVAESREQYVQIALRLAHDPAWRAQVRARILAARHVLFDSTSFVRELEEFLIQAVGECGS